MSTKVLSDKTINSVMAVVLVLSIATWVLSRAGITEGMDASALVDLTLFLAYVKAALIIYYYLEIKWAPVWLKAACAGWVSLSFLSLLGVSALLP